MAKAFDNHITQIIKDWWAHIAEHGEIGVPESANVVDTFVKRIAKALEAFNAHELTLDFKRKRKVNEDDDHSPEMKRAMEAIDREVSRGEARMLRESQRRRTRSLEAQRQASSSRGLRSSRGAQAE